MMDGEDASTRPGRRGWAERLSDARTPGSRAEPRSFEHFFLSRWDATYRLAALLGASDAEDVAQEAFARVHSRFDRLEAVNGSDAYMHRVVCNLVISRARRRQTASRHAATLEASAAATVVHETDTAVAVSGCLDGLSMRQRQVIVLRYWLDLSEAEIADALRIRPGSVKTHASRGLSNLRTCLGEESA